MRSRPPNTAGVLTALCLGLATLAAPADAALVLRPVAGAATVGHAIDGGSVPSQTPILGPELGLAAFDLGAGTALAIELTEREFAWQLGVAALQGWTTLEIDPGQIANGLVASVAAGLWKPGAGPYVLAVGPVRTLPAGQTSGSAFTLQDLPEPAALLLFGLGLTVFGIVIRRRRKTTR